LCISAPRTVQKLAVLRISGWIHEIRLKSSFWKYVCTEGTLWHLHSSCNISEMNSLPPHSPLSLLPPFLK
jgi:hypothetical protein